MTVQASILQRKHKKWESKKFKPVTSASRYKSVLDFAEITETEPYKPLTLTLNYKAGRGDGGKIAVRHKGGRVKRKYRIIDFKRRKANIPAVVKSLEYDPNRSAFISLICYKDGEYSYILAPDGIKVGDTVQSGAGSEIKIETQCRSENSTGHKRA